MFDLNPSDPSVQTHASCRASGLPDELHWRIAENLLLEQLFLGSDDPCKSPRPKAS